MRKTRKILKKLWKVLKNIGYANKPNPSTVVLKTDDTLIHDNVTVANKFNYFFTNVASNLVSKLPTSKSVYNTCTNVFKCFYGKKSFSNFKLQPVSHKFVYDELKNLNPTKSTGLDKIPARFLKDGACVLTAPLTHIINLSIESESVPDDLKLARITPIHKKKLKN